MIARKPSRKMEELRDKLQQQSQIDRLSRRLKQAEQENKFLRGQLEEQEVRNDFMSEIEGKGIIHQWVDKHSALKIGHQKKSPIAALAPLSDWHIEERVRKDSVSGFNEYNPAIAERRAQRIFQKIGDHIERHTPYAQVLYLGLLGDFVTGYIHEELEESNYMSPVEAILKAQDMLCSGIEYLRKRKVVKKIICPTACGNHGRTGAKTRISTRCQNSYEWMMYQQMANTYKKDSFIDILVCTGYHMHTEIFGRTVRWHHGDAFRGGLGVGGPTIPILKKIAQWNDSPLPAELDLFGHLHNYLPSRKFVLNGSLIGHSPYAVEIGAAAEPPSQSFVAFSKSRGMYLTARMFCEDHA